jgi:methylmalonyl-CoA/ethylmalonyl-CoA epimerase
MITGLSHVSIAVPDIAAAARQLSEKYGLEVGTPVVNEQQGVRLAYVELGAARIELMEPSRPDSPIAKFLERNPRGGIHHFCIGVDDVGRATHALAQNGVRVLGDGQPQYNVAGERIAFIHPGDFLGALVELEAHQCPEPEVRAHRAASPTANFGSKGALES